MWIGVLGAIEVRTDQGALLPLVGTGRQALLVRLALDAGRWVSTDQLIHDLYGEQAIDRPANALQSQVSRLRRILIETGEESGSPVEHGSAGYRLAVPPDRVDALRFERLARAGRRALRDDDAAEALRLLDDALTLWRGPALADLAGARSGAEFVGAAADRLRELELVAIEDRAEAELETTGRAAAQSLGSMVAAHPLRERLRGLWMRALVAEGRAAEALEVFEQGRSLLADHLGADPSTELTRLHLDILRGRQNTGRQTTTRPDSRRPTRDTGSRLTLPPAPEPLTGLVGAEQDVSGIRALLRENRLVTVLGQGGVGKTRRAIAVATDPNPNGTEVAFVDLTPLGAGDLATSLADAFGLRDSVAGATVAPGSASDPRNGPIDRLAAALGRRRLLLVLDNAEHVLPDLARVVVRLLEACPGLRVLVTSQESLGIPGEARHPVAPLAVPETGASVSEAAASPAVQLFLDRAGAARPSFELDGETVRAVVSVCRALDGLPLALELAAARLSALSVVEVAARLDDRFTLLRRRDGAGQARHRTLRAAVEWSWELLEPSEAVLARRLSVFSGAVELDTLREVCGIDPVEPLTGLVDKSLVEATDVPTGRRYRMPGSIRLFASERLAEAGELDSVRDAHARFFLHLATGSEPELRGPAQLEALARLASCRDDLRDAMHWAAEREPERALGACAALCTWWWIRGDRTAGAAHAAAVLSAVRTPPVDQLQDYLMCLLTAGSEAGDEPTRMDAVIEIAHMVRAPLRWPLLAVVLPAVAGRSGRAAGVVGPFVERIEPDRDPWVTAARGLVRGHMASRESSSADPEVEFRSALDGFRTAGDRWGEVQALTGLALTKAGRGDDGAVLTHVADALELTGELEAVEDAAELEFLRGAALRRMERGQEADRAFDRAIAYAESVGATGILSRARRTRATNTGGHPLS